MLNTEYIWALSIVASYLCLCWYFLILSKKAQIVLLPSENGGHLLIAYASQSGQAEDLAKHYANSLEAKHNDVLLLTLNQITRELIDGASTALFIVSTYGEGEPPDNALRFYQQWLRKPVNNALDHLRFAVLALGDSEYRNFCSFGTSLTTHLTKHGANPIFETVKVDGMNEQHLSVWRQQLHEHGLIDQAELSAPVSTKIFSAGFLTRQDFINQGSPGDPAYHLSISLAQGLSWQAGDIVEIKFENNKQSEVREYSIASLPEDNSLDLLVRQVCKEDGSFGLGSGWLTREARLGSKVNIFIRSNPAFHAPSIDKPLILIGNGTGLAGLRAHLKARVLAGAKQNCLLFGERTKAHDYFFKDEILQWQETGHLSETHLAFSQDQAQKRYVQDLVAEQAQLIRAWVEEGASIYVCGSLEGMASGVDLALQDILGESALQQMKIDGTYARDVY